VKACIDCFSVTAGLLITIWNTLVVC